MRAKKNTKQGELGPEIAPYLLQNSLDDIKLIPSHDDLLIRIQRSEGLQLGLDTRS